MSKPGHNSSDNRLKSLADRIERLMDERDGIQSDIRDIYAEAKSAGYVPKVLRKAITRKRMDPDKRDEEDTILDLYEDALSPKMRRAVEMAKGGATSRQIEDETGIDHATVARSVALNKKSETPEPTPVGVSQDGVERSCGQPDGGSAEVDADETVAAPGPHDTPDLPASAYDPDADGRSRPEPRVATPFMGDDPGPPPSFLRRAGDGPPLPRSPA